MAKRERVRHGFLDLPVVRPLAKTPFPVFRRDPRRDVVGRSSFFNRTECGERLFLHNNPRVSARAVRDPHELARLGVPLGQAGAAQDIANGVLFLASDVLRHMIGAELVIGPPEYDDG
jgi:hypothetical protein